MSEILADLRPVLKKAVFDTFGAELTACAPMGAGMSGEVYRIEMDKPPFLAAVKTAKKPELLKKECAAIRTIRSKADVKLPELYFEYASAQTAFVMMQFFDGVNCADDYLLKAKKAVRQSVAEQIADNIVKLQQVKGEKYGSLEDPRYDDWHDFYRPFAEKVYRDAEGLLQVGLINQTVYDALNTGISCYDRIFVDPISAPTLIHGDYWAQNIMIDRNFRLIGVVDPFNSMWADSEYELFALNAVYGAKLPVLEAFLKKVKVSEHFLLKNSFYLLFSETFWVTELRHDNEKYLNKIVKGFYRELKRFKIEY